MNTQNLLIKLFNEGDCLTYDWHFSARRKAEKMCEQFMLENPHGFCFVQNQKVPIPLLKHTNFQYFSNGVLVVRTLPVYADKTIKQARKILALHGYVIKDIYAPQNKEEWQDYFKLLINIHDITKDLPVSDED